MERRLAAILATDMVGFSRLMAADESGTIERQLKHRERLFEPSINAQGGRIIKSMGDGLLVEFGSASHALNAAIAIQSAVEKEEADFPADRQMRYRMGINLGEVVHSGSELLGDGINVAARLESISPAGGVCVSDTVRQATSANLDIDLKDFVERSLKNIGRKVQTWLWTAGDKPGSLPAAAGAVLSPEVPSIAVLPFRNYSKDEEDAFLCDSIAEDIVTALSKIDRLFVVARSSTAHHKDKDVDPGDIRREQGVRYILEGSLRRAGNRVRVTAQLTDTVNGQQVFAERYDRPCDDIFDLQDEITREVTTGLQVKLTDGEQARLWASGTRSFEAWQLCFQASELIDRHAKDDTAKALRLLNRALEIDPNYSTALCKIGWVHWSNGRHHWVRNVSGAYEEARKMGLRSHEIDRDNAETYSLLAMTAMQVGNYEEAEKWAAEGGERAAGQAFVLAILSMVLVHCGNPKKAIGLIEKAMELCPLYPNWFRLTLGRACYLAGDLDRAIVQFRAWYDYNPKNVNPVLLIAALDDAGRADEAQEVFAEMAANSPALTISEWARDQAYKDPNVVVHLSDVLRKYAMPE